DAVHELLERRDRAAARRAAGNGHARTARRETDRRRRDVVAAAAYSIVAAARAADLGVALRFGVGDDRRGLRVGAGGNLPCHHLVLALLEHLRLQAQVFVGVPADLALAAA